MRKGKKRILGKAIDAVLIIISIALSLLLIVSYSAQRTNPNSWDLPSLLGLLSPAIYIACLVLFLYWVIRWRPIALVLMIVLAVGYPKVKFYYNLNAKKDYSHQEGYEKKTDITLMSYNVRGFIDPQGESSMEQTLDFINSNSPDIICIQEFQTTPQITAEQINSLLGSYAHHRIKFGRFFEGNKSGWGQAIYSKYPIINSLYIDFPNTNNSAMWVDIKINKDTLRVYNLHLQSSMITKSDMAFLRQDIKTDTSSVAPKTKLASIAARLSNNNKIRANQSDTLMVHLKRNPHPVIVCGDFNDTPMSYSYGLLSKDLNDAFCQMGRGASTTFASLLRIDYVFYSDRLTLKSYQTPESEASDHKPVLVRFSRLAAQK